MPVRMPVVPVYVLEVYDSELNKIKDDPERIRKQARVPRCPKTSASCLDVSD